MTNNLFRWSGVAGVAVIWVGVCIALLQAHQTIFAAKPLSYLGVYATSAATFNGALLISAVLFIVFALHVKHTFKTSLSFLMAFIGGQLCQLIVGLVPIVGSQAQQNIHVYTGLALGLSLPVLIWRFAAAQTTQPLKRQARILSYIELGLCLVGLVLSRMTIGSLAEFVAAIGFHAWIIWLTTIHRSATKRN